MLALLLGAAPGITPPRVFRGRSLKRLQIWITDALVELIGVHHEDGTDKAGILVWPMPADRLPEVGRHERANDAKDRCHYKTPRLVIARGDELYDCLLCRFARLFHRGSDAGRYHWRFCRSRVCCCHSCHAEAKPEARGLSTPTMGAVGCLIGLPSFLIAERASETTFFDSWLHFTPTDDIIGLLYLLNGVLCLFVFEAVRRERVVSVWIPLRRVTILAFLLSAPALVLHQQVERIEEHVNLPGWAWLALAVVGTFFISQMHDGVVHLADGYFNRWLDRVEHKLGEAIRGARSPTEIEQVLADQAFHTLELTSAASFRHQGSVLSRDGNGKGWENCGERLRPAEPLLAPLANGAPFRVKRSLTDGLEFPQGLAHPVLAVPAINPARCFAVSLYGPHASGTDLDDNERSMLARIAHDAAAIHAELESKELRKKVTSLEDELKTARAAGFKARTL